ncbi:MAG: DUF5367 family protein [Bacteroidota bacterium]
MNIKRAIISGVITWILGVLVYSAPYILPFIENSEQYVNVVFPLGVVLAVIIGAYFYYHSSYTTNGFRLGIVMIMVAIVLDALITVPLFIIPEGGNHFAFFTDLSFWLIAAEFVIVTGIYWRWIVVPNRTKSQPV